MHGALVVCKRRGLLQGGFGARSFPKLFWDIVLAPWLLMCCLTDVLFLHVELQQR